MTRVGPSQMFFNMVAGFNARKLISDQRAAMTVMKAVSIDSIEAMIKPLDELAKGFDVFINNIKQVSSEMGLAEVEFQKFYSGSQAGMERTADQLKEIGLEFGKVGDQALNAGSRAAQVGQIIGNENIPLLVRQGEILSNISDLNSEEAMKGLIQLQQQTGVLYGNLTAAQYQRLSVLEQEALLTERSAYALDALNTIANRSVALEGDLVGTMTNFAAQGQLVGEAFHDMAAMSAVLLEAGEEQGAAGRALRMMYARLGGDIGGARTELEQMGISITDENGNLNTMREIMETLVNKGWHQFSAAQKQNIAQTVAGNRHYVRFIKLMENNDRFLQLASDGMEGYDSATEQAEKAMENFANQLIIAEAESENLKAQLGETFHPFLLGQQKAENEILEVKNMIGDMFGPTIMEGLGRFTAFMKHAGGFVKFGLGVQGMALGMGMFEAVQADLHGLLVANENLHSKQATWMEYGRRATKEEEVIIEKIRHKHQMINQHLERQNQLKGQLRVMDMERNPLLERESQLQDKIDIKNKSIYHIRKERVQTQNQVNALLMDRNNSASRYSAIIKADLANQYQEINLLSEFNRIRSTSMTSDNSKRQQMIIDHEVMNSLTVDEIAHMMTKKDLLMDEMGIFQRIVADNEKMRGLRAMGGTEAFAGPGMGTTLTQKMAQDAYDVTEQKVKQLTDAKKNMENASDEETRQIDEAIKGYTELQSYLDLTGKDYDSLTSKEQKRLAVLKKSNRVNWAATQMSKERTGMMIHLDNILSKRAVTLLDVNKQQQRVNILERAHVHAMNDKKLSQQEQKQVQDALGDSGEEYERILREITEEQKKGNDVTKQQMMLQNVLKKGYDDSNAVHKMMATKMQQNTKVIGKAQDATRKFGFALSAVSSVLMPMFVRNTNSVMASTLMLSTTLIPALAQVTKATKAMMVAQADLIAKLGKAQWLKVIGPQLAAFAAIGTAVAMFTWRQNNLNDALKHTQGIAEKYTTAVLAAQTQTHLFTEENDFLADKLGLLDVEVKDLLLDEVLLADTTRILTQEYEWMDKAQVDATASALALANALSGVNDSTQYTAAGTQNARRKLLREFEGGWDETINTLDEVWASSWSTDRKDAAENLKNELDLSDEAVFMGKSTGGKALEYLTLGAYEAEETAAFDIEEILDEIFALHDQGIRLTEEQMGYLADVLDNDAVYNNIETLNNMIMTTGSKEQIEDTILGDDGANAATANIDLIAGELNNLTGEIYDFGNAREELFFGGKYGNVTGSLYKQVVKQGVGVLYNKMDIVMSNNFHGFFNEKEAADKIMKVLNDRAGYLMAPGSGA